MSSLSASLFSPLNDIKGIIYMGAELSLNMDIKITCGKIAVLLEGSVTFIVDYKLLRK